MASKVMTFLLIILVIKLCVSPKVEARNVKLCCFCEKTEDCKSFCGNKPPYRCVLNICACSNDVSPKIELQELMRAQTDESGLH
ncbi:hypothetical protein P3S68_021755 [Capsicum galapagoense]